MSLLSKLIVFSRNVDINIVFRLVNLTKLALLCTSSLALVLFTGVLKRSMSRQGQDYLRHLILVLLLLVILLIFVT